MKVAFDGDTWLVRLEKGELLIEVLTGLVKTQGIEAAWVNGLGGALWVELGFYDLESKQYHWQKLNQPLEITGLQGNVAWSGAEPVLHIHGSFSDSAMKAYGGHVKELAVAGTCEVRLQRWQKGRFTRLHDDEVGLQLLDI